MKTGHHTGVKAALIVTPDGNCELLHTEVINLAELGQLDVKRATDIAFDNQTQEWVVKDTDGRELFRHASRDACVTWERGYISRREDEKHGGVI
jgi:hypothetical protein